LTRVRLELDNLKSQFSGKLRELSEAQSNVSQLSDELASAQKDLNKALDKLAKNECTILELNEQVALVQHEVR
jgi:chromosome segregation ATPase